MWCRFHAFKPMLIVLGVILYALLFQGSRGVWEPDEGRYTAVGYRMLKTGEYFLPSLNSEVSHFSKPPLAYWAVAAGVRLLGRNEWGVRLVNSLAFAATILMLFVLGRIMTTAQPWLPALVYASFGFPYAAANIVTTDTLLTLWEVVAVTGFVIHWHSRRTQPSPRGLLLMWTGFGLAFLTKGPPGLLPLAAIACFAGIADGRKAVGRLLFHREALVFLVLGLGWYVGVAALNPSLFTYFMRDELLFRVASAQSHRNPEWYGPFRVYGPVLLAGTLPWTAFLLVRANQVSRTLLSGNWWRMKFVNEPWLAFSLIWFLLPLAVFCLSRSRLPLYVLPLFAPLALLAAILRRGRPLTRRATILLTAWFILLPAVKGVAAVYGSERDDRACAQAMARALDAVPKKLVFVDCRARWGVGFYLDCEVKDAEFVPATRHNPLPKKPIADELAERGPGVVLVVPDKRVMPLLEKAVLPGRTVRQIARTDYGVLIALDP